MCVCAPLPADTESDPPPPPREEKRVKSNARSESEAFADLQPMRKKGKRQGPALTEEDFRDLDASEDLEEDDWEVERRGASQKRQRMSAVKSRGSR